jgi:Spy/CpxP family protein refolding chaperone
MRKTLVCFLGLFWLILGPVHAQSSLPAADEHHQNGHRQHIQEIFSQLNLTDEQKKELEANKQQHRSTMMRQRQQIRTAREDLKQELMRPQLDMARIHHLHDRIKALMAQMEDDRLASILAVRVILTPEQFGKFINLMPKLKDEKRFNGHDGG